MANYGLRGCGNDELRDWLLGGNRKRRILERLANAPDHGYGAEALARELDCSPATVYEALRALRGAGLLDAVTPRRYRLGAGTELADALRGLIAVLERQGQTKLDRPHRTRR